MDVGEGLAVLLLVTKDLFDRIDNFLLVVVALVFALFMARPLNAFMRRVEGAAEKLGRRPVLSLASVFLFGVMFRVALLPIAPVPAPQAHDEFSYLLSADTFAHGRLTNPTPAMWKHIESFHIIVTPTYQSQYPPGQGLLLALGQVLGHPFIGVVLGTALMCALLTWALRGWMSPKWSLIAGFLMALKYCGSHYWTNSYWGGALAVIGAALVFGAAGRLMKQRSARDAALMALGAMVLANTRPYEGLVFVLVIGGWVMWRAVSDRWPLMDFARRVAVPVSVVVVLIGSWMAYYNWRVTGSATTMPYEINIQQYKYARPFLWQRPVKAPEYRTVEFKRYFAWELYGWEAAQTPEGLRNLIWYRTKSYYDRYLYPMLVPFLIAVVLLWRGRRHRILLLAALAMWFAVLVESWGPNEHYLAPALPVLLTIIFFGMRYLRLWKTNTHLGLHWSRVLFLFFAFQMIGENVEHAIHERESPVKYPEQRSKLAQELEKLPGKDLVVVRYGPNHDFHHEWVFNGAAPDDAPVIWARELSPEENGKLFQYYHDREVWVVNADEQNPRLQARDRREIQQGNVSASSTQETMVGAPPLTK